MKKIFCVLMIAFLLLAASCGKKERIYDKAMDDDEIVVLVDAGHGLGDTGAMHDENLGDVNEAEINFSIATYFAKELEKRGYKVIMSHDGETRPKTEYDDGAESYGPGERADFSNSTDADIFVSVHCDSYPADSAVYGTRVYYAVNKEHDTEYDGTLAKSFAKKIDSAFPDAKDVVIRKMIGADSYTVLYRTKVPAVLVECGFITNKDDAEKLKDRKWQKQFAASLADGVDNYFGK